MHGQPNIKISKVTWQISECSGFILCKVKTFLLSQQCPGVGNFLLELRDQMAKITSHSSTYSILLLCPPHIFIVWCLGMESIVTEILCSNICIFVANWYEILFPYLIKLS